MTQPTTVVGPGALLREPVAASFDLGPDLRGFGGLHGGLTLALLARAMQQHVPDATLRSVTGRFDRPLRGPFRVDAAPTRVGRAVVSLRAVAVSDTLDPGSGATWTTVHVRATATFSPVAPPQPSASIAPARPEAPGLDACPVFSVPVELAPFGQHTEIRPVGSNRPFGGGDVAELTAWVRFVGDDTPPDALGLVVLMDALAPSFAAVLTTPAALPTIELTVRPVATAAPPTSPWVLLQARTRTAHDGWIDEQINAWSPEGTHLASASQLRLLRG
jgi:acyl-coenzyme A thioesterase PaaI-like protein